MSTPMLLTPPRWGRVGVGVMSAECIDSIENRSSVTECKRTLDFCWFPKITKARGFAKRHLEATFRECRAW